MALFSLAAPVPLLIISCSVKVLMLLPLHGVAHLLVHGQDVAGGVADVPEGSYSVNAKWLFKGIFQNTA